MPERLIASLFKYVDERNWDCLRQILSEDIVYERPGYNAFVGRDRVLKFYEFERVIAHGMHALEMITVGERCAACCGRFSGAKKDGTPVDVRFADMYRIENGLISRRTTYFFEAVI